MKKATVPEFSIEPVTISEITGLVFVGGFMALLAYGFYKAVHKIEDPHIMTPQAPSVSNFLKDIEDEIRKLVSSTTLSLDQAALDALNNAASAIKNLQTITITTRTAAISNLEREIKTIENAAAKLPSEAASGFLTIVKRLRLPFGL